MSISSNKKPFANSKALADLANEFWAAADDALFPQQVIAAVRHCAVATLERERCKGDGIPFLRIAHRVLYRKRDVRQWIDQHPPIQSTSEQQKKR